jgi:hypothetical protein
MREFLEKAADKALGVYLLFVMFWICTALSIQLFFVYLQVSGNDERSLDIANRITRKIDGNFKNNPENIWYEPTETKNN